MLYLLGSGLLGSLGLVAWLVYTTIAAIRGRTDDRIARATAERDLATTRTELARVTAERDAEAHQIERLGAELAAARREATNARIERVTTAAPGDVGAAVDRLLDAEAAARRAGGRDGAVPADAVRGAGPASDGPTPVWALRDG